MIGDIAKGITTKFSGSALSTTVGGRVWRDRAKQNETMPYIVFTIINEQNNDTFTETREYHHIMFYIWTDDVNPDTASTGLDALESALKALFDGEILTISGWTNEGMINIGSRPANSEDSDIIGVMVEYETYIQKT